MEALRMEAASTLMIWGILIVMLSLGCSIGFMSIKNSFTRAKLVVLSLAVLVTGASMIAYGTGYRRGYPDGYGDHVRVVDERKTKLLD